MWGGGGVMILEGNCWQVSQFPSWVGDLLGILSLLFPKVCSGSRLPDSCHFTCPYCINLAGAQVRRKPGSSELGTGSVFLPPG